MAANEVSNWLPVRFLSNRFLRYTFQNINYFLLLHPFPPLIHITLPFSGSEPRSIPFRTGKLARDDLLTRKQTRAQTLPSSELRAELCHVTRWMETCNSPWCCSNEHARNATSVQNRKSMQVILVGNNSDLCSGEQTKYNLAGLFHSLTSVT